MLCMLCMLLFRKENESLVFRGKEQFSNNVAMKKSCFAVQVFRRRNRTDEHQRGGWGRSGSGGLVVESEPYFRRFKRPQLRRGEARLKNEYLDIITRTT
jgi:hypothetical protein